MLGITVDDQLLPPPACFNLPKTSCHIFLGSLFILERASAGRTRTLLELGDGCQALDTGLPHRALVFSGYPSALVRPRGSLVILAWGPTPGVLRCHPWGPPWPWCRPGRRPPGGSRDRGSYGPAEPVNQPVY